MIFNLGEGGFGVDNIYDRYGATVSVGTPIRPGYVFTGWSPSVPATMPAEDTTYTAGWDDVDIASYTVNYWIRNANDDDYAFFWSEQKQASSGTSVNGTARSGGFPSSVSGAGDVNTYFTFSHADQNVTINADGTSVGEKGFGGLWGFRGGGPARTSGLPFQTERAELYSGRLKKLPLGGSFFYRADRLQKRTEYGMISLDYSMRRAKWLFLINL